MIRIAAFILSMWLAGNALAADAPTAPTIESSLNRGLKSLLQQRNHDGSFGEENTRLLGTSRALLVFLQRGNVPDSGRYGTAVKDAEEWMIRSILPSGNFGGSDGRTRSQAAAVLALAEVYGVESNSERRSQVLATLRLAVQPLLSLQTSTPNPPTSEAGGWSDDKSSPVTLASTAVAATALCCARDCGVSVPESATESAKRYISSCRDGASGGYGPQHGKAPTIDSTAAALVTLDVLSPAADDNDAAASSSAYFDKQAQVAGNSVSFTAAAWICWCDARLQLPSTVKLKETTLQHLMATQQPDGGWTAAVTKPDGATPSRLAVTELALIGLTAHFRSTPVLRH